MITMLKQMQKKNSGIPVDVLPVFEEIISKYHDSGVTGRGNELNAELCKAMDEHLTREGKPFTLPSTLQSYFESCAVGRLYELQKALGIKLKIKSVDISALDDDANNPVVFTFEVVDQ